MNDSPPHRVSCRAGAGHASSLRSKANIGAPPDMILPPFWKIPSSNYQYDRVARGKRDISELICRLVDDSAPISTQK